MICTVFRRRLVAPLLLSLFVCLAAPLGAQEAKSGSAKLDAVVVSGSAKFQSAQIASVTGLKPGDQVTRDDIQKGADALANFGPFSKVQYRFSTTDSGVRVEYIVADAPSVPAMFDNFPWFTDDQLIAAIKTSVPLFDGTAPERGSILDDISNVLSRDLVAHGVVANVSHELITLPNGRQVLMFHAEGPSVNVQEIQFSDPLAGSDPAIHDRLADLIGKPFSREAIRLFELEQVRPIYLQHAFLRVKFGELNAKVDGNKVVVQAPIDPGPAFTWSGVKWSGNTALASTDLDKLVQLNDGGAADGMKILATWENVRNAFSRHGFLDFTMDPEPSFDDAAKRVTYSVKITEGTQYHMGKLVLTGLSMEGERRIRTGWKLAPGAIFDEQAFNDFVDSGAKEAFGNLPVHYERIGRFLQKDPTTGKVDVMLDFQ